MHEYWTENVDQMLDYINAARVFNYQYSVERVRGQKYWHVTVYTEKLITRAQQALNEEEV